MGDLMDRIQKTVAAENKRSISGVPQRRARGDQTESMSNAITEAPDTSHMLPAEGDGNKFAGFFV